VGIDIVRIAGYDPNDPEILAAREDFDEFADLITELHRARKAQGITQKQVAKTMQTKQSAVSEIERIGGNPTIRTLLGFSRAVGMRLRLTAEPTPLAPELIAPLRERATLSTSCSPKHNGSPASPTSPFWSTPRSAV